MSINGKPTAGPWEWCLEEQEEGLALYAPENVHLGINACLCHAREEDMALISAAPDLLAACKLALEYGSMRMSVVDTISAAIRKAEVDYKGEDK